MAPKSHGFTRLATFKTIYVYLNVYLKRKVPSASACSHASTRSAVTATPCPPPP